MVENLQFFGGRGASSGLSDKGKKYGSEYKTLYQTGNIKFVSYNNGSATAPMETMTDGRVYAVVNTKNEIKVSHITIKTRSGISKLIQGIYTM